MNYEKLEEICGAYGSYIDNVANGYSEPGYTKDYENVPIYFANWNSLDKKAPKLMKFIRQNINIEWSDEWANCQNCNGAVRTVGNSYNWTPYYNIFNDCELICGDCIKDDLELQNYYLNSLINNPNKCNMFLNLEKLGFKNLNGVFENGFYGKQDNPETILKMYTEKFPNIEIVFGNISCEQFRVEFEIFGREKNFKG